jgi:prepilin-type N-terminal cleavage/methylation domain-containing protein
MSRSHDPGFTLLELMVVVLVISLAMGLAYPALSRGTSAIHLRATARDILNTFRHAREKAVTEQTGMRVAVYRDRQELVLTDDFGAGNRRYVLPQDVRIERILLSGTEITEGPLLVRFIPNGSSDDAEVLLKSKTGSYLRVVTDPITGGARVESGQGENTQ